MIDRRVQKTLASLHRALMELVLEKGYEAISVGDVIERANVGRSTFYSHYSNKNALLQSGIDELGKELAKLQRDFDEADGPAGMPLTFSYALFTHAHGYKAVYRAMVGHNAGTMVSDRMRAMLRVLVRRELAAMELSPAFAGVPQGAVVEFLTGSVMSTLMWWVDERTNYSADEVDVIFRKLALAWTPIQPPI